MTNTNEIRNDINKEVSIGVKANKAILNRRNLKENIPIVLDSLGAQYKSLGLIRLSMLYFAFCESYIERDAEWSSKTQNIVNEINLLISDNIANEDTEICKEVDKKIVTAIDELRNTTTLEMEVLSSFNERFKIYEFALNRTEYKFKSEDELIDIDNDDFTREILQYIFQGEDQYIINEKIKEIIEQLPVRITRQRYFDIIEDASSAYNGAYRSTFSTYMYLLRSAAMLYDPGKTRKDYPQLIEYEEYLKKLDYKNLTEDEFIEARTVLDNAIRIIDLEISNYISMQEIINNLYAIVLCPSSNLSGGLSEEEKKTALDIIKECNKEFKITMKNGLKNELNAELGQKFFPLEGVQETLAEHIDTLETGLHESTENHEEIVKELGLINLLKDLNVAQGLLSTSLFIDFSKSITDEYIPEIEIRKETLEITKELKQLFKEHDRTISRAVMANTLGKVPVFLKSHTQVMEYIRYSLEKCTDKYEKMACYEIINGIILENSQF